MGKRIYDSLKFTALVILPAVSALYFGFGQIWGFPAVEQVVGSIAVLDAVLGTVLAKSSQDYLKKAVVVEASLGLDENGAAELQTLKQINDKPLIFENGQLLFMRARVDNTPPPMPE